MSETIHKPLPSEVVKNIEEFVYSLEKQLFKYYFASDSSLRGKLNTLFKNFGWKYLSEGNYAQVYDSPCGKYVLKVNFNQDTYSYFAQTAILQPENPYLPNIFWHVSPVNVNHLSAYRIIKSVTLIEKLNHMDFNELEFDRYLFSFLQDIKKKSKSPECFKIKGDLGNIACSFKEISQHTLFKFDLRESNFMLRGDQVVINDPIK